MRRPTLMIAVGMPGPHGDGDEDQLDRERDDGGDDDDIATEAICSIVRDLHQRGPDAVRRLRLFADALAELCDAFMKRDRKRFEEAAADACDALHEIIQE